MKVLIKILASKKDDLRKIFFEKFKSRIETDISAKRIKFDADQAFNKVF